MRTTVTLSDEVAAAVEQRRRAGAGVSEIINDLARRGLRAEQHRTAFTQRRSSMGAPVLPLDDVGGLLDTLEGDGRPE